jgi:hypothetical protein
LYHIPCSLVERIKLNSAQDKKLILIYDENSKYFKDFEKVYRELSKNKNIDLLDIDDLKLSNFCSNNGLINSNSKIILIDVDTHDRIFLVNFCLANEIPISTYGEKELYDREIIDIIDSGIIKTDRNFDLSLRTKFSRLLDRKYSSYKKSEVLDYKNIQSKFQNISSFSNENLIYPSIVGKKYLETLNTKENDFESLLCNPLTSQSSSNSNNSLYFISVLLDEQKNKELSDDVFLKFYNILIFNFLNEKNNWKTYNTIIRFVHLRPSLFCEALKTFSVNYKNSKNLKILLKLSIVSLSSINVDQNTIMNFLDFILKFKNMNSSVLYLFASNGIEASEYKEKFDFNTINQTVFDLVSYNLILNESQIKFIKEIYIENKNYQVTNINDIYTIFTKGLFENVMIDFNYISIQNPYLYNLFFNNPYHLFRLFATSWLNNSSDFSIELLSLYNTKHFDTNPLFYLMHQGTLLLTQGLCSISTDDIKSYLNQNYNQFRKIFFLKVLSYDNYIGMDFDKILTKYNFKYTTKLNNILSIHFNKH